MAPLQDGRSADSTSDPKKTGGEGNKAIKLLKMLESKKQKNVVGRLVAKKNELDGCLLAKGCKNEKWNRLLSC